MERREVEPRDVLRATLATAERHAGLGAIARLEPALAEEHLAAFMDRDHPRRPAGAVPILAKDLGGAARGLAPAAGSTALRRRVRDPEDDDSFFASLRSGGFMPIGLSTVPEFGLSLVSAPEDAPPIRNPWNPALSAGGSSGGAAAAVSSGIVALAHATDAAGSIRVPAACCGLVGFKPSRSAISQGPDFGNHLMGLAAELVLARTVRDVRLAFDLTRTIAGQDDALRDAAFAEPIVVGLAIPNRCDAAQVGAARAAAEALARDGCEIREVGGPDDLGAEAAALARIILTVSLAEWLDAAGIAPGEVQPLSAAVAAEGRALPGTAVFAATREVARITALARAIFDGVSILLMPVLSGPPPRIGAFDPEPTTPSARFAAMEAFAPNAALANVAGLPALALPFGIANGLPVGIQLWAPSRHDDALLGLGARLEALAPPLTFPFPIAGLHDPRPRTHLDH